MIGGNDAASSTTGRAMDVAYVRCTSYVGRLVRSLRPIAAVVVLWELVVRLEVISAHALPSALVVAKTAREFAFEPQFVSTALLTLSRVLAALALSIVVGATIGLLMAHSPLVNWIIDPIVSFGFPIPMVTLVPIYLLWFGFGTRPIVLLAMTTATFPIIIATNEGARSVDRELRWAARTMGVSRYRTVVSVTLPAALPRIMNGIQIALFVTFSLVIVTEMVSSGGGLGERLVLAMRFHRTPEAFVYLFTATGLGVTTDTAFRAIQSFVLRGME